MYPFLMLCISFRYNSEDFQNDMHMQSCFLLLKKKRSMPLLLIMDFPLVRFLSELLTMAMANVYEVYEGKVASDMTGPVPPFFFS